MKLVLVLFGVLGTVAAGIIVLRLMAVCSRIEDEHVAERKTHA